MTLYSDLLDILCKISHLKLPSEPSSRFSEKKKKKNLARKRGSFFSKNPEVLKNIIPSRFIGYKTPKVIEDKIISEYKKIKGLTPHKAREQYVQPLLSLVFESLHLSSKHTVQLQYRYLNYVRNFRAYGCSFFPVCHEPPPAGFFEFRIHKWHIGIGPEGLIVIEKNKGTYHFIDAWENVKWIHSPDTFVIYENNPNTTRPHKFRLISPQSHLIHNLAARLAYLSLNKSTLPSRVIPPPSVVPAVTSPVESGVMKNDQSSKRPPSRQFSRVGDKLEELHHLPNEHGQHQANVGTLMEATQNHLAAVNLRQGRSRQGSLVPPPQAGGSNASKRSESFVSARDGASALGIDVGGVQRPLHDGVEDTDSVLEQELEYLKEVAAAAAGSSTYNHPGNNKLGANLNEAEAPSRKKITPLSSFVEAQQQQSATPRAGRSRAPSVLVTSILNNVKQQQQQQLQVQTEQVQPRLITEEQLQAESPRPTESQPNPRQSQTQEQRNQQLSNTLKPVVNDDEKSQFQKRSRSNTATSVKDAEKLSNATKFLQSFIPPTLMKQLSETMGFDPVMSSKQESQTDLQQSLSSIMGNTPPSGTRSRSSSVNKVVERQVSSNMIIRSSVVSAADGGRPSVKQNPIQFQKRPGLDALGRDSSAMLLQNLSDLAQVTRPSQTQAQRNDASEKGPSDDGNNELLNALQEELASLNRILEAPLETTTTAISN
jgi:hypothetical protein